MKSRDGLRRLRETFPSVLLFNNFSCSFHFVIASTLLTDDLSFRHSRRCRLQLPISLLSRFTTCKERSARSEWILRLKISANASTMSARGQRTSFSRNSCPMSDVRRSDACFVSPSLAGTSETSSVQRKLLRVLGKFMTEWQGESKREALVTLIYDQRQLQWMRVS